eukprot:3276980-Rhodomonas_salina.1
MSATVTVTVRFQVFRGPGASARPRPANVVYPAVTRVPNTQAHSGWQTALRLRHTRKLELGSFKFKLQVQVVDSESELGIQMDRIPTSVPP